VLRRTERYDDATRGFLDAIRIDPRELSAHRGIQRCLTRHAIDPAVRERARDLYEGLLAEMPEIRLVARNLALLLELEGRAEEAERVLRERLDARIAGAVETVVPADGRRRGPDFIIIGAMKCGTTSLYQYLSEHPQILPAAYKEISFFNRSTNFQHGLDWYRAFFPPVKEGSGMITGEATPGYIRSDEAARRIRLTFPDVKLIAVLRNPADRSISHYHHSAKHKVMPPLAAAVRAALKQGRQFAKKPSKLPGKRGNFINASLYHVQMRPWIELFPREQILVLRLEDLQANPVRVLNETYAFLGLPPHELRSHKVRNKGSYRAVDPEIRKRLVRFFAPYNRKLEKLLRQKFHWR